MEGKRLVAKDTGRPYHLVVQTVSKSLIKPVFDVCCATANVTRQMQTCRPSQQDIWEAERSSRPLKSQIYYIRKMERRMAIEQFRLRDSNQKLESLEHRMERALEKAENANFESILFEQQIPSLRTLLKDKFNVHVQPVAAATSVTPAPEQPTTAAAGANCEYNGHVNAPNATPSIPIAVPSSSGMSTPTSVSKFKSRIPRLSDIRSAQKSPRVNGKPVDSRIHGSGSATKATLPNSVMRVNSAKKAIISPANRTVLVPSFSTRPPHSASPIRNANVAVQTPRKFWTPVRQQQNPASSSKPLPNAPLLNQTKYVTEPVNHVLFVQPSPAKSSVDELTSLINMLRSKRL